MDDLDLKTNKQKNFFINIFLTQVTEWQMNK